MARKMLGTVKVIHCEACGEPPGEDGLLVCPSCERRVCLYCQPAGRGTACTECEEAADAD